MLDFRRDTANAGPPQVARGVARRLHRPWGDTSVRRAVALDAEGSWSIMRDGSTLLSNAEIKALLEDDGFDPSTPRERLHVLVADGDAAARARLAEILAGCGCAVSQAATARAGLSRLVRDATVNVLLVDAGLPGLSTGSLCAALDARSALPVALLLAGGSGAPDALLAGAPAVLREVLPRPVAPVRLRAAVGRCKAALGRQ